MISLPLGHKVKLGEMGIHIIMVSLAQASLLAASFTSKTLPVTKFLVRLSEWAIGSLPQVLYDSVNVSRAFNTVLAVTSTNDLKPTPGIEYMVKKAS